MTEIKLSERGIELLNNIQKENIPSISRGVVCSVSHDGNVLYSNVMGEIPELSFKYSKDTIFDMASLTKPLTTATIAMKLLDRGKIGMEDPVTSYMKDDGNAYLSKFSFRMLLSHSSGLADAYPLQKNGITRKDYINTIDAISKNCEVNKQEEYSDLNYILLGLVLEEIMGETLDVIAEKEIFKPLGMKNSCFNPNVDRMKIAPTEITADRGQVWGKVHDEKADGLGGVTGHAGLFSTIEDVEKYVKAFMNFKLFSRKTTTLMTTPANEYLGGTFGLGWMIKGSRSLVSGPSFGYSLFMGDYSPLGTVGHTGFTGTSLVMDLMNKISVVVLTNRVFPTRENTGILKFRRLFHNIVFNNLTPE